MTLRLGSVVINCSDIDRMTGFWSGALGLEPSSDDREFRVLRGDRINVSLQVSKTPVGCRDQMHFDLYTAQQKMHVDRLLALGATYVRHNQDPHDDYVVLADPEGNLLCVCLATGG